MVKQGPIPAFVHGLYEYLAALALIALPIVLDYQSESATAVSVIAGILLLFLTATTTSSTSLVNQVPLPVHILLDYVLAVVLIAAPFAFGFSDETEPTVVFIAGGVIHLLLSIATRYRREEVPKRGAPKGKRRAVGSGSSDRGVRDEEIPEFKPPPPPPRR